MRKQIRRRGTAWLMFGTMMMAAVFTGCGKKDIDYDIDGSGGKKDSGSIQDKYDIPKSYDDSIAVGDSGLSEITLKVDEISVPDTSIMYTEKLTKNDTAGEALKKIAEAIFDKSKGIYAYDENNQTKADIEEQIASYEQLKKDLGTDAERIKEINDTLTELQDELEKAPEDYPAAGDYSADDYVGTVGGKEYELYYKTDSVYRSFNMREDFMMYRPKEKATYVTPYSKADYERETGTEADQENTVQNACSYSKEEAQMKAEEFLSKIGAKDVALQDSSDLYWVYTDATNSVVATDVDGYSFTYVRAVDKQPVSTMAFNQVENLQKQVEYYDVPVERYEITMDSNGIINANWCDYLESTGESAKTEILSFPELLEKANETIPEYYKTYPCKYNAINFNDVTLTYYLTAGAADGQFEYKPVWIFSSCDDKSDPDYPSEMVVLDAADGSVIDMLNVAMKISAD